MSVYLFELVSRTRCAGASDGLRRLPIEITKDQLDQFEVRGYFDPDLRGDRADETEAIEMFLMESLLKR